MSAASRSLGHGPDGGPSPGRHKPEAANSDLIGATPWQPTGHAGVCYQPVPQSEADSITHALTIDLEDWQQSVYDRSLPVSDRFITGTYQMLGLLAYSGVRATFFVLGVVAEKAPRLVRELHDAGHEVQIHGYDHTQVSQQSPEQFRQHLLRAKGAVENAAGCRVSGFRAPRFSIVESNLWALDVLAECGFRYDSSIFPMRLRGYGITGWPSGLHWLRTQAGATLLEVPVATVRFMGRRLPLGGGGYFRLAPLAAIRMGLSRLQRRGMPAVIYCHPYELDVSAFKELGFAVPWQVRLHQGLGRRGFDEKLRELLDEFAFGPLGDLLPEGGPAESGGTCRESADANSRGENISD